MKLFQDIFEDEYRYREAIKELSMAKEVKEKEYINDLDKPLIVGAKHKECKEVHFGQAIQIGTTAISNINTGHEMHKTKLQSPVQYVGHGVEFKFDGKECLVPMSVIKLIIFA